MKIELNDNAQSAVLAIAIAAFLCAYVCSLSRIKPSPQLIFDKDIPMEVQKELIREWGAAVQAIYGENDEANSSDG